MEPLAELRTLISRHAQPAQGSPTQGSLAISGLTLLSSSVPTLPMHCVYEPVLAVIAQGAKRTELGDRVIEYAAGQYLVVSIDLPVTGHVTKASVEEPFLCFGLKLNPAAIAALLLETVFKERAVIERTGLGVSTATNDLLDPIVRFVRLLDHPEDIAVLGPMIEREILWRLLAGEQGAMVRQIGLADSRLSQISHAIRWIRDHYAEIVRIEDLAELAAMSVTSFHRHFRAVTTMSPLQYQKHIRLQEARSRLLAEQEDVGTVGFKVGYDSPSQFSREYSRMFGAPPGRDSARLRNLPAPERSLA
jgi:AraC-like DNA-binding protein